MASRARWRPRREDSRCSSCCPAGSQPKARAMRELLAGKSPDSAWLFRRVALAADALEIPRDAIGGIVTLAWLHHGLSGGVRADARAARGASSSSLAPGPLQQLAAPWL